MSDVSKLQDKLRKMCSDDPIYKAIFFSFASRARSREETSVDATMISIVKIIDLAESYVKGGALDEDELEKIKLNKTELRELFRNLREAAKIRASEKNGDVNLVPKSFVENLFRDFEELGIGKYIRGSGRNKSRFRWTMGWCNNLGCAALGKCDLIMNEEYEFLSQKKISKDVRELIEEEVVVVRGAKCIIRYEEGFDENDNKMLKFYKSIKNWVELELEQYDD